MAIQKIITSIKRKVFAPMKCKCFTCESLINMSICKYVRIEAIQKLYGGRNKII